jgi:hypothetical protein
MAFGSAAAESEGLAFGSLGAYVIGPPIVHVMHGRPLRGLGSLGLRVGLPILGAFAAVGLAQPCGGDFGCIGEAALGTAIGFTGAIAIDAAVLAYEERPTPSTQALSATPFAYVDGQRALFGVGGAF